jgi:pilus assembly protein CpaB
MDSSKRLIILLIAGVLVAFAAIAIRNRLSPEVPTDQQVASKRVVIAKRDITPGSSIQVPQDADWADVSEEIYNKEGLLRESEARLEDINGTIVRRMVRGGEPVEQAMLTRPGSGGLMSAVLEPGMRAVSISVNAISGNAGFVLPGDRVDLILTREFTRTVSTGGSDQQQRRNIYSKTFITDVRVLAADQMLDNPENKAVLVKTVSVEVTPQQAKMIAVASELGKISLALRSAQNLDAPADQPEMEKGMIEGGVSDSDMQLEPEAQGSEQVRILRPGDIQNMEFYRDNSKHNPAVENEAAPQTEVTP